MGAPAPRPRFGGAGRPNDAARRDMKHRLPVLALVPVLAALVGLAGTTAPALAKPAKKKANPSVFEACHHGCHYRTIQKAVDAAGAYAYKNPKAKGTVPIRSRQEVRGVVADGP